MSAVLDCAARIYVVGLCVYRVFQKNGTPDNFRKCAPILAIFSLVEQEIYDA